MFLSSPSSGAVVPERLSDGERAESEIASRPRDAIADPQATTLALVIRSCERPGCSQPATIVYGYLEGGDTMQLWLDSWFQDVESSSLPADGRGVVCERHGALLTPPRGWDLVDRRETMPRLFAPKPVLVHSQSTGEIEMPPAASSARGNRDVDTSAEVRRKRVAEMPAPQLFADRGTVDGSESSSNGHPASAQGGADDELSSLLDATGPLLRRAFGKRNVGRHDASRELMRPTTGRIVDESA